MDCVQPWSQGVRGEMGDEDPGLSFQGPGTEVGLCLCSMLLSLQIFSFWSAHL